MIPRNNSRGPPCVLILEYEVRETRLQEGREEAKKEEKERNVGAESHCSIQVNNIWIYHSAIGIDNGTSNKQVSARKRKKKKRKVRIQYYDFILQHHSSLYSLFLLIFPLDKISLHYLFRNDWRLLSLMREYVFSCFPCWGLWILWKESVFTRSIKKFNSTFQNYCSFCNQLLLWKCAEWIINHSIYIFPTNNIA